MDWNVVYTAGALVVTAVNVVATALRTKKARRYMDIGVKKINGTYRVPAYYEVEVTPEGESSQKFRVRTINEIPEPYRAIAKRSVKSQDDWIRRFLDEKPAEDTYH